MKRQTSATSLILFAGGLLVSTTQLPNTARAAYLRATSSLCQFETSSADYTISVGDTRNDDASTSYSVFCPFVEYDDFNKTDVSTLNVYIHDNDSSETTYARACWHDYSGALLSCSSWENNGAASATGDATLQPSTSIWNTTTGIAYVETELPPDSYLEGVYFAT